VAAWPLAARAGLSIVPRKRFVTMPAPSETSASTKSASDSSFNVAPGLWDERIAPPKWGTPCHILELDSDIAKRFDDLLVLSRPFGNVIDGVLERLHNCVSRPEATRSANTFREALDA
jgi:hypothetical protein